MKLDVKRNAKKGIAYGLIHRVVATVLPFLVQSVFIRQLGIEYVGVKGLFTSILTVFNLAELGFGSAIVFSMYKPIAEENDAELCALLSLFRKIYGIIGAVILILALLIMPFLPRLINGSYPHDINIYCVFMLFTAQTILSYWLFAYKSSLFQAYQRTDVISIIGVFSTICTSIVQIGILLWLHNFYLYLIVAIVFTLLTNIITSVAADRMYPEIQCRGKVGTAVKKDIKKRVAGVFIGRVCYTTRNTFDTIFISAFIGLSQTGIYTNYFYILSALTGIMSVFSSSLIAGIGNRIILESKEKNFDDMMRLNALYLVISGWAAVCMLCLYQPFMTLWLGKENLFPNYIMILFPIYFYIQKMGDVRGIYSDAAGLYWENRWRTISETVANIVLNYLFVRWLGVFGIVLATIITLFFIGFLGSTHVIFKYYFNAGKETYLLSELKYLLSAVVIGTGCYLLCNQIIAGAALTLIIRALICISIVPAFYWMLLLVSGNYSDMMDWILRMMRK